jgi:hypothetical protein
LVPVRSTVDGMASWCPRTGKAAPQPVHVGGVSLVLAGFLLACRNAPTVRTDQEPSPSASVLSESLRVPTSAGRGDDQTLSSASVAVPNPSATDATASRTVVRFHLIDTMTTISGPRPPPVFGPDTEPTLDVMIGAEEPRTLKLFPCAPKEAVRPAFGICNEFKTCKELDAVQLTQLRGQLPSGTLAAVACAHSPQGPAHVLALRILDDAAIIDLSRTDPDPESPVKHPLCAKCPPVRFRDWKLALRVPVPSGSVIRVESTRRTRRTVGTTL